MKGLFDNLENLLPIIVVVVVAVSSWLKKKRQGDFETGPSDDDEPLPLPPKRAASGNWEEELRHLLEDEQPVAPPQSAPPPIVIPPHRPPPLPTPARQSAPPPVVAPRRAVPAVSVPPVPAWSAAPRTAPDEALPVPTRQLAHLTQSAQAYDRASHLQEKMETRIAEVGKSHEHYYKGTCRHCHGSIEFPLGAAGTTIACPHCGENTILAIDRTTAHLRLTGVSQRRGASKDARAAVALLRGRQSVRQAMIVSFILGPPKALEE